MIHFEIMSHCCSSTILGDKCSTCKESCDFAQPAWVCTDCGNKYGSHACGVATFHDDDCGICGEYKSVTEPRDFGYIDIDKL